MKKDFVAKILYAVLVFEIVGGIFLASRVYTVHSSSDVPGVYWDGLGRTLVPSPFLTRFVVGPVVYWPGWHWFATDLLVFWCGVGIAYGLIKLAGWFDD